MFNNGQSVAEYIVDSANEALICGVITCHCEPLSKTSVSSYNARKLIAKGALFTMVNLDPDVTGATVKMRFRDILLIALFLIALAIVGGLIQ